MDALQKKVLIIDDDPIVQATLKFALRVGYHVSSVPSGEMALERLAKLEPDIILMDIVMPGMNGYETCKKIREFSNVPVIFVSAHDSLEERLQAFEVGGDDFIFKPFDSEFVVRKVERTLAIVEERKQFEEQQRSLQEMAMGFLTSIGESGVLLSFMRNALSCTSAHSLAQKVLQASTEYGVATHVQIRLPNETVTLTVQGVASALEVSIFEKLRTQGRIFQFSRRLIINYDLVSIIVLNLPLEDPETCGRIRDNVATLVESAEIIAGKLLVHQESKKLVTSLGELRTRFSAYQVESHLIAQSVMDSVEKVYSKMELSNQHEVLISAAIREKIEELLGVLKSSSDFLDGKVSRILEAFLEKEETAEQMTQAAQVVEQSASTEDDDSCLFF